MGMVSPGYPYKASKFRGQCQERPHPSVSWQNRAIVRILFANSHLKQGHLRNPSEPERFPDTFVSNDRKLLWAELGEVRVVRGQPRVDAYWGIARTCLTGRNGGPVLARPDTKVYRFDFARTISGEGFLPGGAASNEGDSMGHWLRGIRLS